MRKFLLVVVTSLTLVLGVVGGASAEPSNYPTNPNACVGTSSTTANTAYQSVDPDKLRADQATQADGQAGRADSVAVIPQCLIAGVERGNIAP